MNKSNMIIIDNYPMIKNSHTTLSALADIAANTRVCERRAIWYFMQMEDNE